MTTTKHYAELKSNGICPHCAKRSVIPGQSICEECKASTYPKMAAARKTRYKERKNAGLCTRCGKHPPVNGETQCDECKQYLAQHRAGRTAQQKERHAEVTRSWAEAHPERLRERDKRYRDRLKQDMLDHYGRACVCCGESTPEFLTLDHINGGGNKHRISLFGKPQAGNAFYRKIRVMGYPAGFQTLCWNCNMAKAHYGVCPHQKE